MNYGDQLNVQLMHPWILSLWLDKRQHVTYLQFINILEIYRTSKCYVPTWSYPCFQTATLVLILTTTIIFWIRLILLIQKTTFKVSLQWVLPISFCQSSYFPTVCFRFGQYPTCICPATKIWGDLSHPTKANKNRKSGKI